MGYEINVSHNGRHFFATHERSLTDDTSAKRAFKLFQEKFPASEGYEVTVHRRVNHLQNVTADFRNA